MRRAGVCLSLLTLMISGSMGGYAATHLSGAEAPDFVLKSLSGENLRLSEYRGQVVMLSFWATWCGDCRAQLAGFNEVYGRYREAGFELLAVSLDRDLSEAQETATNVEAVYPVLYDAGREVSRLYDVGSMPLLVLIDREGIVREVFQGYRRGGEQEYLERVKALLRE